MNPAENAVLDQTTKNVPYDLSANSYFGRLENIVGKGQNTGYQHFLLSHNVFDRRIFQSRKKPGIVW